MMFSVVIPMFNASGHIVKALESCTQQTLLPKEIIIVDDCSSDDSYAVVEIWKESYRGEVIVILKRLEVNSGPSKARNVGWDLASGEYVAFLDADDTFMLNKLEFLQEILAKNKEIVLLGHGYATVDADVNKTLELKQISTLDLLKKNLTATPAIVIKREIEEHFDESMRYTEDHDLWLRVTQKYNQTVYADKVLTMIDRPVRSKGGQSANLWEMRKGELRMYKKYCKTNGIILLYPIFVLFSLTKHSMKWLKGLV